jgi:arylsulfatase K
MTTCYPFSLFLISLFLATVRVATSNSNKKPNIVFLVCESTDGRTWQKGYQNDVIPLPNIRALEEAGGYSFHRNYANSPVCCTSRSSFWSGRHAHKIPHVQRQSHTNSQTGKKKIAEMPVDGVWNNFEGLPLDFDQRIDQILEQYAGYETCISGKRDWSTGGHSRNVQMGAWTMYTQFPYNMYESGGWRLEKPDICASNGTVLPGNMSAHGADWRTLKETVQWIHDYSNNQTRQNHHKPFFVYQGMDIVHPPYNTNEYYYDKIDPSKIRVPEWPNLEDMHPCDFQSSMLKGCIPALNNATATAFYYSKGRRRNIRRIYYAMIAEFDAMVGAYMQAIRDIGEWDNTIFIVTSDHGDLQMEHQQSYKMVPYDASSSVPLVIYDGRQNNTQDDSSRNKGRRQGSDTTKSRAINTPTQLIDLYPTIMELVGVDSKYYPTDRLDGYSLVPLMTESYTNDADHTVAPNRPDFVVSQFHGMNIAMSWFLIVQGMPCIAQKQHQSPLLEQGTCLM